ncbi:hypothetical protein BKI49_23870 [Streptomyces sp. Tue6028]|uniref:hypothetical protein n=1 Tax=Streptomyces sp. Tue6028 TaxID=2036037 RepID=UPI000BB2E494|nr:hypothetical protein [Streptomyces sp. Tue6028]PBC61457.1 hypothetical protein BKI49_23870 [Streptomyces sp. Tue6028]
MGVLRPAHATARFSGAPEGGGAMHPYLVAAAVLAVVALAGLGIVAITTGWLMPLGRHRVLRPKLWGYGAVTASVGMTLFMFLGPFHGPDAEMTSFAMSGMGLFLLGNVFQLAAQRPGRP